MPDTPKAMPIDTLTPARKLWPFRSFSRRAARMRAGGADERLNKGQP